MNWGDGSVGRASSTHVRATRVVAHRTSPTPGQRAERSTHQADGVSTASGRSANDLPCRRPLSVLHPHRQRPAAERHRRSPARGDREEGGGDGADRCTPTPRRLLGRATSSRAPTRDRHQVRPDVRAGLQPVTVGPSSAGCNFQADPIESVRGGRRNAARPPLPTIRQNRAQANNEGNGGTMKRDRTGACWSSPSGCSSRRAPCAYTRPAPTSRRGHQRHGARPGHRPSTA